MVKRTVALETTANQPQPNCLLVGMGVVGRAILDAHLAARVPVQIADSDAAVARSSAASVSLSLEEWEISELFNGELDLPTITFMPKQNAGEEFQNGSRSAPILIESIAEKLQIKQDFFRAAERRLSDDWILCSNTSTLRIRDIAAVLERPNRFCGMHFFMPVADRDAVELIYASEAAMEAGGIIERCCQHIKSLGKSALVVPDSPGFIVNRMLSPYLNEAMVLLSQGATEQQIERAAIEYGMPLSPLELIDLIGTRTMFDAGRVYWQAFPSRIDPSPILPAMIKAKRGGKQSGHGFYDYDDKSERRSDKLALQTTEIVGRYTRDLRRFEISELQMRLSATMWIEAAMLLAEGTVADASLIARAMSGGLGFQRPGGWFDYFDSIGSESLSAFLNQHAKFSKSLVAPARLIERLRDHSPSEALVYTSSSK